MLSAYTLLCFLYPSEIVFWSLCSVGTAGFITFIFGLYYAIFESGALIAPKITSGTPYSKKVTFMQNILSTAFGPEKQYLITKEPSPTDFSWLNNIRWVFRLDDEKEYALAVEYITNIFSTQLEELTAMSYSVGSRIATTPFQNLDLFQMREYPKPLIVIPTGKCIATTLRLEGLLKYSYEEARTVLRSQKLSDTLLDLKIDATRRLPTWTNSSMNQSSTIVSTITTLPTGTASFGTTWTSVSSTSPIPINLSHLWTPAQEEQIPQPKTPLSTDQLPMVPHYVVGYRGWVIVEQADGRFALASVNDQYLWKYKQKFEAKCQGSGLSRHFNNMVSSHDVPDRNCTCGVYAFDAKNFVKVDSAICAVMGTVAMWGRVVHHKAGYRAQFAYPLSLTLISGGAATRQGRLKTADLTPEILSGYDIPVNVSTYKQWIDATKKSLPVKTFSNRTSS